MIIMADVLEVIILFAGFLYWPLLYVRLHDTLSGVLTKRKLGIAVVFAIAATLLLTVFNFKIYDYQDPYTFAIPLIAIASVAILAIGKTNVRRTNVKLIVLAAYLHIFWQVMPKNFTFILADLAGITIVLAIVKMHPRIKAKIRFPHIPKMPTIRKLDVRKPNLKIRFPSVKPKEKKPPIEAPKIKPPSIVLPKISLRDKLRRKKKPKEKKESKKGEEKPISLKELWSN